MFEDNKDLFKRYQREFKEAECAVKAGESIVNDSPADGLPKDSVSGVRRGLFLPAINELRYAGKHLGDFVVSENIEDLYEAIFHCVRARNDACDCLSQYYLGEIRTFMEQYESINKSGIIEGYSKYHLRICNIAERSGGKPEESKEINAIIRGKIKAGETVEDERVNDCKELSEIYKYFISCRDELDLRLVEERRSDRRYLAGIIFTILSVIVTIIGIIVTIILSVF